MCARDHADGCGSEPLEFMTPTMNYFAMIHWSDEDISPVLNARGLIQLWETDEDARKGIEKMPIYNTREITIHDIAGE